MGPTEFSVILVNGLNSTEVTRRMSYSPRMGIEIKFYNPSMPSLIREKYNLLYVDLIKRLRVNMQMLDYNYTRLNRYLRMFADEQTRIFRLRPDEIQLITEKEYPMALEFFMQFDGRLM
jgi:hypothetical protein